MQIVPVIDVQRGQVVRAAGGERTCFEPLESDLCPTADPYPLAYVLRERFDCKELYLADLDAIAGGMPDWELISGLIELGFLPWVDAGVRDVADAIRLRQAGAAVVVGSETINGPDAWERIVRGVDSRRLTFSLDVREGKPVAPNWPALDAQTLVEHAVQLAEELASEGLARLIVLDLDRVGSGRGVGTEALLHRLVRRFPNCDVFAGGGIRGPADIRKLEQLGVAGALVSTAMHEGLIQPGVQSKAAH